MAAPKDHCWLCNNYGTKTKGHIPPESAFNDLPLLLLKVDERSTQTGAMDWDPVKASHMECTFAVFVLAATTGVGLDTVVHTSTWYEELQSELGTSKIYIPSQSWE